MARVILPLSAHVANQIAAGEVVQRPASVVKELVENALDAGASEISCFIVDAGRTSIQIVDNGQGIDPEDLPAAFQRHATSKLTSADDLFSLQTMGFRGEALASIAAVSQSSIRSKTKACEAATELHCDGGELGSPRKVAGSNGTRVTVKNLFYNIPARRQFLKNDAIEFKHIADAFASIALAWPEVKMELKHNQKDVWLLEPGNSRQRVAQVLGRKSNERLIPVGEETEVVHISGFVLKPEHARKTRGDQFLYVNQRPIRNGYLHRAICDAFDGLLHTGYQPGYVLFLRVPAHRVDMNVHPAKTEVKFEDEKVIYAILRSAIKRALGIHQVSPTLDFETNLSQHVDFTRQGLPKAPSIQVNPNFNPFHSSPSKAGGPYSQTPAATPKESFDFFMPPSGTSGEQKQWEFEDLEVSESSVSEFSEPFFLNPSIATFKGKTSLLFVHMSRAWRHVLYHELKSALSESHRLPSQSWIFPQSMEKMATSHWPSWVDVLPRFGFQWEGETNDLRITAGPYFLSPEQAMEWLYDLLKTTPEEDEGALQDYVLNWLEAGKHLNGPQGSENPITLIDRLWSTPNPWVDSRGNRIALTLDSSAIARKFS